MEDLNEILNDANRCLNCKNARCIAGCPISTNIPKFIKNIKENNFKIAYEILQENNFMSQICSIVCPVENQCVGNCIRGIKSEPIKINKLEKFINDWANLNNIVYNPKEEKLTNKKVAIIGSGPAGIACAVELKKAGADVTIFEKENKCGGILEYGIPDFRLPKETLKNLIQKVLSLGIDIKTGIEFGKDFNLEDLKKQGYNNVFLALGAQKQNKYSLSTDETESIYDSDEFLKKYNYNEPLQDLGIVVVIGGGNVAFDSARAAIRRGAEKVYILYRRTEELMPGCKSELEETLADGVEIVFQTKVLNAKVKNKKVEEIECIKTKIENNKAVDIEGSNYTMEANTIIFAIGAKASEDFFEKLDIEIKKGLVCVDENYMTNKNGIYAGGDLVEAKSSVCKAISTGKKAAKAIIENERNVI